MSSTSPRALRSPYIIKAACAAGNCSDLNWLADALNSALVDLRDPAKIIATAVCNATFAYVLAKPGRELRAVQTPLLPSFWIGSDGYAASKRRHDALPAEVGPPVNFDKTLFRSRSAENAAKSDAQKWTRKVERRLNDPNKGDPEARAIFKYVTGVNMPVVEWG